MEITVYNLSPVHLTVEAQPLPGAFMGIPVSGTWTKLMRVVPDNISPFWAGETSCGTGIRLTEASARMIASLSKTDNPPLI